MKSIDLLFVNNEINAKLSDSYLEDMGLSFLPEIIDDERLNRIFTEILSKPLINKDKIIERQKIIKDFMRYPSLLTNMKRICDIGKENKFPPYTRTISGIPPKIKMADYLEVLLRSLNISGRLASELEDKDFESDSLKDLYAQVKNQKNIELIREKINELAKWCLSDNYTLSVSYNDLFKFESANIYADLTKATHNADSGKWSKRVDNKSNGHHRFIFSDNFLVGIVVEDVEKATINNLSFIMSNINTHILAFCSKMSYSLAFYISVLKIINWFKLNNVTYSFPIWNGSDNSIRGENLIDFGLAYRNQGCSDLVANDFADNENSYYFISGVNQGGKTTFIKSIGIAQIFAQAGLPVTAAKYVFPIFHNFVSHFPKEEDEALNFGKLAEELTRIRSDFPMMTDRALILLNESFATTTENEGCDIAVDFIRAFSLTDSKLMFVTHIYKLLKNTENINSQLHNNKAIINLIAENQESATSRSYKIVEGEPQENIHTFEFLNV